MLPCNFPSQKCHYYFPPPPAFPSPAKGKVGTSLEKESVVFKKTTRVTFLKKKKNKVQTQNLLFLLLVKKYPFTYDS